MANKRYSDVSPNKGEKDSAKPGIKSDGCTKPTSNPTAASCKGPDHARIPSQGKGSGKDLPAIKCEEKLHQQPTGDLPKGI